MKKPTVAHDIVIIAIWGTDDCIVGIDCMSGWAELVAQTLPLLRSLLIANARTFRA